MKILFDANTPAPLARWLRQHEICLATNLGWHTLKNGDLLDEAEREGFDLLLSCDNNLPYQQNFRDRRISVIVLSTNTWRVLRPVAPRIAALVEFAQRGQVMRIDIAQL